MRYRCHHCRLVHTDGTAPTERLGYCVRCDNGWTEYYAAHPELLVKDEPKIQYALTSAKLAERIGDEIELGNLLRKCRKALDAENNPAKITV